MIRQSAIHLHLVKLVRIILLVFMLPVNAQSDYDGELILFPFLQPQFNSNVDQFAPFDDDEYDYGIDLFGTFEHRQFRLLGEALLSKHNQHVERLQLGWIINHNNRLWLGRFHNPLGFWNTHYHHGDYLETPVSRPGIAEFEHDGGILPLHLAGLLYEGLLERDDQGFGYQLALAAGNEFRHHGLEAWDPLDPGATDHDITATINLYYEPEILAPTRFGIFASYGEMPGKEAGIDEIQQTIAGIYGNWDQEPWHVISSIYYVHNKVELPLAESSSSFLAAYIQASYSFNDTWSVYTRLEGTAKEKNDSYLALFPDYMEDKILGGVRLDVLGQHAFKLQLSSNHTSRDDFIQLMFQWSAVFGL